MAELLAARGTVVQIGEILDCSETVTAIETVLNVTGGIVVAG